MRRIPSAGSWSVGLLLSLAALGCQPGGVGDPCTPEDEYQQNFNGFQVTETNVESRSFQCETRLCLVNHFQGRVSCRLGQTSAQGAPYTDPPTNMATNGEWAPKCSIPGTKVNPTDRNSPDNINVEVPPQLVDRQTDQAVYCSCRCDGPDKNARYCECPEGFQCEPLVDDLKIPGGGGQLAGSYCIRAGSKYDTNKHFKGAESCATSPASCDCDKNLADDKYPNECGAK
jgi:hypothetical protein